MLKKSYAYYWWSLRTRPFLVGKVCPAVQGHPMKCVFFQRCVWGYLVEGVRTASYQIGGWQELPKLSVCVCVQTTRTFLWQLRGKRGSWSSHQYHFQSSWTFGSRCCHRKPIAEVSSKDMVQRIDRLQIFSRWDRQELNMCLDDSFAIWHVDGTFAL